MVEQTQPSLEELATDILRKDAKKNGRSLRKEGIIDERRQRLIRQRETSLEHWLHEEGK